MSNSSPRLAIIGISGYGRIHLSLVLEWVDRGAAQIVAAVVINPEDELEAVADLRRRGCRIYADDAAMWREQAGRVELCLIPTGIHLHTRMTLAALRAGANVLVEKPLAGSTEETDAIRMAEREQGRFVAVGFQDVYASSTVWLRAALAAGRIGQVKSVRFLCVWPRPKSYFLRNNWAGCLVVNGAPVFDSPLNNACGHFVLLSLLFAGGVENIMDSAELYRAHNIESFDTAVVTLSTAAGVKLWFGVSHCSHVPREPEIVIEGTAGMARWTYEREALWQDSSGRTERLELSSQQDIRREMMDAVMRRLTDAGTAFCTTEMAARHTALVAAVHQRSPVESFAPDLIEWSALGDEAAVPIVKGLDEALMAAFASGRTLAEVGFPPFRVSGAV